MVSVIFPKSKQSLIQISNINRFPDSTHNFEKPTSQSKGFKERRSLFLTDDASQFSTDWVQLSGRLHFDLDSLSTGILPGINVLIILDYSTNEFRIQSSENDETFPKNQDVVMEIGSVSEI